MTGRVILEGLEFHAYHGIYPHERSSGNKFELDVIVETEFREAAFHDHLSGTINYEEVYAIVKEEMAKPSKLLERVGDEEKAIRVYERGMEEAKKAGDDHSYNELRAAYEELAF